MRTLKYKTQWRANEVKDKAIKANVLISWWRTMNGETVLVIRRVK